MDYDDINNSNITSPTRFNITFNVTVNNQFFVINFSNERLSSDSSYVADTFIGIGDAYSDFLKEVESNIQLQDKNQFSDETKNAANDVIGAIAQSVYLHVQSHSPDQDEE